MAQKATGKTFSSFRTLALDVMQATANVRMPIWPKLRYLTIWAVRIQWQPIKSWL
jgi:hypothetical protein